MRACLIIFSILICGCVLDPSYADNYNNEKFNEKLDIPLSTHDININHVSQIDNYLDSIIRYQDNDYADKWQSLEESKDIGYGDCEDFCIGFTDILMRKFGKNSEVVLIDASTASLTGLYYGQVTVDMNKTRKIEAGGKINHAMVRVDGVIVDPQDGMIYNAVVSFSYTINWL